MMYSNLFSCHSEAAGRGISWSQRDPSLRFRMTAQLIVLASVVLLIPSLYAQSISDLDLGTFERQSQKGEVKANTNPFAGGLSSVEDLALEDLQLTGVVYRDEGHAFALVSGYLVKVNDKIAGYKVDKIDKDSVRLRRIDEVVVLSLGGGV